MRHNIVGLYSCILLLAGAVIVRSALVLDTAA